MAFTKEVKMDTGTVYSKAYFKINDVRINDTEKRARFQLQAWKDEGARSSNPPLAPLSGLPTRMNFVVRGEEFDKWFKDEILLAEGASPVKQAYLYARSTEMYSDAKDVLE